MMNFLKGLFTAPDNVTPSLGKVAFAFIILNILGIAYFDTFRNHHVDFIQLCGGIAAITGAYAFVLKMGKDQ